VTVYGVNPVMEALKARRVTRIFVGRRDDQRLQRLLALAAERRVPVERVDPEVLDRRSRDGVHQGVVAELSAAREYGVVDLVEGAGGPALLVVLDGIEDPHNVGAIVRSVDAAGAHGVVRQTRRAAALDAVAAKASAGAVQSMVS
jgi:23S rRNA (guanosine2251-2'-O)-methyltransferase